MRETRKLRVVRQPPAPQSEWKFETRSDDSIEKSMVERIEGENFFQILEDISEELENRPTSVEIRRPPHLR